jgi:hypothetical protein
MRTIYDNEVIARVASYYVGISVRLDNPGLAKAKFGTKGKQSYKLKFKNGVKDTDIQPGETVAIPAGKLVNAYWDAVNNPVEITAFES